MPPTPEEQAAADAEAAKVAAEAKATADKAAADAEALKAKEVTIKQGDIDRIAGDSRAAGRTAAEKEILATLGVTDIEAAKAVLATAKAAEDASKTELQLATEARDAALATAAGATALAAKTLAVTRLEGSLRDAGLNPERIAAAVRLVDLDTVKVEGTDVSGVAEAVEKLKVETPEWFGAPRTSAPDASGDSGGEVDFRTASKEDHDKELYERYGLRT